MISNDPTPGTNKERTARQGAVASTRGAPCALSRWVGISTRRDWYLLSSRGATVTVYRRGLRVGALCQCLGCANRLRTNDISDRFAGIHSGGKLRNSGHVGGTPPCYKAADPWSLVAPTVL